MKIYNVIVDSNTAMDAVAAAIVIIGIPILIFVSFINEEVNRVCGVDESITKYIGDKNEY